MIKVGKSDLFWNYGASFMRVASGVIVLPLILRMLPSEEVGLWTVMIGLNSMIYLLDFGFFPTFSRSITYIFSGARELKAEGFESIEEGREINYSLLKGNLNAMRYFYAGVALLLILTLFTGGYWYIERLLVGFKGDMTVARTAWYLYGILLSYQFYTYYFDGLLVGRGMIKRSRQIIVLSQSVHIVLATILLLSGFGIISMVISQTTSTIVNRMLAYRAFYDKETKTGLLKAKAENWKKIIKTLWQTAYKSGLANLSWVFTNKMLTVLGAAYIPLVAMGSYGITKQIVDITYSLSVVWFVTYYPKLTQERVKNSLNEVKRLYVKGQFIAIGVFAVIAAGVVLFGDWGMKIIDSSTPFLDKKMMLLFFLAALFEALTYLSTSVLLSRNAVPHYKAQTVTALVTAALLVIILKYTSVGVLALIIVPFISQLVYHHWRWTLMVIKELGVKMDDYIKFLADIPGNLGLR